MHFRLSRVALNLFPASSVLVEMLSFNANCRMHRRHLLDLADKRLQRALSTVSGDVRCISAIDHRPVQVERVAPKSKSHNAPVHLGLLMKIIDEASRAAHANG